MYLKALDFLKNQIKQGGGMDQAQWIEAFEALPFPAIMGNITEGLLEGQNDQSEFWLTLYDLHLALIGACEHEERLAISAKALQVAKETVSAAEALSQLGETGLKVTRSENCYFVQPDGGPIDLVGDQHSDPDGLVAILKASGLIESALSQRPHRMIMMGDYVDRGRAHLEMTAKLLALKYILGDRLILLRGNHDGGKILEDGSLKLPYGKPEQDPDRDYFPLYLQQVEADQPAAIGLLKAYLNLWNHLAYGAVFGAGGHAELAVHGGIPRPLTGEEPFAYLHNLEIMFCPNTLDPFGRTHAQNVMWSDPYKGSGELREGMGRFYFTEDQAKAFLEYIDASAIYRGHEALSDGVVSHFNGLVTTIFSSGGSQSMTTAYSFVSPKILRVHPDGRREAIPVWPEDGQQGEGHYGDA